MDVLVWQDIKIGLFYLKKATPNNRSGDIT